MHQLFLVSKFSDFPGLSGAAQPPAGSLSPRLDSLFKSNAISSGSAAGLSLHPTTPFHQAGIPAAINQSADSPWMSVNMFSSLTLSSPHFSFSTFSSSFGIVLVLTLTVNINLC